MITKEQLKFLAASAEFQKLLEEDEHIRELEASKYNRREEFSRFEECPSFAFLHRPLENQTGYSGDLVLSLGAGEQLYRGYPESG